MRVLLTGTSGFIGSHVARALVAAGDEVFALARTPELPRRVKDLDGRLDLLTADVTDAAAIARAIDRAKPETCIHLAWYAEPGKYLHANENLALVSATLRLAERLRAAGCRRFVGAGTCFEYDTSLGWLSETSPTAPKSVYAASKLALFQILDQWSPPMSFAWARFFYQYGPTEADARLVPHVIRALAAGGTADVTAGEQVRDFLHVADVAGAVCAIAKSELTGAVNVGSGVPVTVRELVTTLADLARARERLRLGALPYREGDPMFVCANVAKLARTGFRPRFDLESGLRDTLEKS